jgi:DNA-binding response OmpR family regulator
LPTISPRQRHPDPRNQLSGPSRLPKILIVEDDIRYAFELTRALKSPGQITRFDVDVVPDISQAMSYVDHDEVDIYIVDLILPEAASSLNKCVDNGKNLVKRIIERSNAGIIVHSDIPLDRSDAGIIADSNAPSEPHAEELLTLGADDYLEKGVKPEIIKAKVQALWRRIKMTRPDATIHFVHTNRIFRIGQWRFVIGNRDLRDTSGRMARLSPTEHAFLQYLCTVEDHEIDRREFNVAVLGRPPYEEDRRIDNLFYRIKEKLGGSIQLISKGEGVYKLLEVSELRAN